MNFVMSPRKDEMPPAEGEEGKATIVQATDFARTTQSRLRHIASTRDEILENPRIFLVSQ